MKKKLVSVVLSLCMVITLIPQVTFAAGQTGQDNTPSVEYYADKNQLMTEFSPNKDGRAEHTGELRLGYNWRILGKDEGVDGDNIILFSKDAALNTIAFMNEDKGDRAYDSAWGCVYPDEVKDSIETVYQNHYGASNLRSTMNRLLSNGMLDFCIGLFNKTPITTYDMYNGVNYVTSDKFYIPSCKPEDSEENTVYIGSRDNIPVPIAYWSDDKTFWLRTPGVKDFGGDDYYFAHVARKESSDRIYVGTLTIPLSAHVATNLNLSSVLFASAAQTSSSDVTSDIIDVGNEEIMMLRQDGSSKNLGVATYDVSNGRINVARGTADGDVFVVVQGKNGSDDWYYSKKVSGQETVTADDIKTELNLTSVNLSTCKIWLETTENMGMIYAVNGKEEQHVSTEAGIREAISAGETYFKLENDIKLNSVLDLSGKDIYIDLNGKVISGEKILVNTRIAKASLHLSDSSPTAAHEDKSLPAGGVVKSVISMSAGSGSGNNNCTLYADGGTVVSDFNSNTSYVSVKRASDSSTIFTGKISGYPRLFDGIYFGTIDSTVYYGSGSKKITFEIEGKARAYEIVDAGNKTVEPVSLAALAVYDGYNDIDGWYDGQNAKYTFGSELSENITLKGFFKYPITYTITYDLDGGSLEESENNPEEYTAESDDFTLKNPSKSHYDFRGWSGTDLTGENNTTVTITKGSTGNRTYKAHYSLKEYTVNFDTDGGSTIDSVKVNWDSKVLDGVNAPTKDEWTFKGWKCGDIVVNNDTTYGDLAGNDETEQITIKAQWVPTHIWGDVEAKAATTGESGYTAYKECEICHEIRGKTDIPQIDAGTITLSETSFIYDGSEKTPEVTVKDKAGKTLAKDTDYTVNYENNKDAGQGNVIITFTGNYAGTEERTFGIARKELEGYTAQVAEGKYVYSGDEIEPAVTVYDAEGNDFSSDFYDVSYENNVKKGKASVIVNFKGNYEGSIVEYFDITCDHSKAVKDKTVPATLTGDGIKECWQCPGCDGLFVSEPDGDSIPVDDESLVIKKVSSITIPAAAYKYSGKAVTPSVSVRDSAGNILDSRFYTVSYGSGRKNVGSYNVTVKLKGNYSGSKTLTFRINPKGTAVTKIWRATKSITFKYKKQSKKMASSRISGYQIRYSKSPTMANAKIKTHKGYKKNIRKISKLKSKTKYYLQARTYKTVGGKKYYSGWSAVKTVKTH